MRGLHIRVVATAIDYWLSPVVETCCRLTQRSSPLSLPFSSSAKGGKSLHSCVTSMSLCQKEQFSCLSAQIISNASSNCLNVSTFSKQCHSFSANLQLSQSIIGGSNVFCSLDLYTMFAQLVHNEKIGQRLLKRAHFIMWRQIKIRGIIKKKERDISARCYTHQDGSLWMPMRHFKQRLTSLFSAMATLPLSMIRYGMKGRRH